MTEAGDLTISPLVSVIICTRNRAGNIVYATNSILLSNYPNYELLIVDQSDDDATGDALAPLLKQTPRIRYFRLTTPGKATALNYARGQAGGEYLALTDDDCEMAPDCLSMLVAAFQADPALGGIFGDVAAAPHDRAQAHIPARRMWRAETIGHCRDFLRIPVRRQARWLNFGMGANMALRAAALEEIHGWDDCIGPGEKFSSGDDHNLAFRLLRAGYGLHFCPGARVVHHGIRRLRQMRQDHRRVGCGFGASCSKYLRCGLLYHGAARTLRFHLLRFGFQCLRLRRSDSGHFILGWVSGFLGGLRQPLNKRTLCFQREKASAIHSKDA